MAIRIVSPRFSFVQFDQSDIVQSCSHPGGSTCLPVYQHDDVAFQFVIQTDTEEEADALCTLDGSGVDIGLVKNCADDLILEFVEKAERYRISPYQVLFNWPHGFPGFTDVINLNECFYVKIVVGENTFCSNCFRRVYDDCYTSVIQYGAATNQFGFSYCAGEAVDSDDQTCEPTFVQFTNQSSLSIPYTAAMLAKYGNMPTVKVWIYNEANELQDMSVAVTFDSYPVSVISVDLGGPASGVLKIS